MTIPLPPFTEPDWSKLPPEAVAWAVDACGTAYTYPSKPMQGLDVWFGSPPFATGDQFDTTTFNWRDTLRLRPTVAVKVRTGTKSDTRSKLGGWAPGGYLCKCNGCSMEYFGDKRSIVCADCSYGMPAEPETPPVEPKPDPHVLADHCEESDRQRELERLAEEAWKSLLLNPTFVNDPYQQAAELAFHAAAIFIAEREKRRNK